MFNNVWRAESGIFLRPSPLMAGCPFARARTYEGEHPDGTPIFNEVLFGGFLIYLTLGLRVFIDDRCELYGYAGCWRMPRPSSATPLRSTGGHANSGLSWR
jgi:hypothetical protein